MVFVLRLACLPRRCSACNGMMEKQSLVALSATSRCTYSGKRNLQGNSEAFRASKRQAIFDQFVLDAVDGNRSMLEAVSASVLMQGRCSKYVMDLTTFAVESGFNLENSSDVDAVMTGHFKCGLEPLYYFACICFNLRVC